MKTCGSVLYFILFSLLVGALSSLPVIAQAGPTTIVATAYEHEYASLQEVALPFSDFTFKTITNQPISLREVVQNKKLVLVHYFAAWCHNSNYDVVTVNELYRQFQVQGLAVIGVCEYSKESELRDFIAKHAPAYPIVLESKKEKDREKTTHYHYRKAIGDERTYGTPFNVLLRVTDTSVQGKPLATHAWVALGELKQAEVVKLIQRELNSEVKNNE